jgi:hypothetical protein
MAGGRHGHGHGHGMALVGAEAEAQPEPGAGCERYTLHTAMLYTAMWRPEHPRARGEMLHAYARLCGGSAVRKLPRAPPRARALPRCRAAHAAHAPETRARASPKLQAEANSASSRRRPYTRVLTPPRPSSPTLPLGFYLPALTAPRACGTSRESGLPAGGMRPTRRRTRGRRRPRGPRPPI